ncbi:unnamed protein product [marine sediment metagenome]|uniref:Uncharacterized protein n=1 Tax=marine sediment metagenome TaxID=412755 RepID=X0YQF8_9ZZZZ
MEALELTGPLSGIKEVQSEDSANLGVVAPVSHNDFNSPTAPVTGSETATDDNDVSEEIDVTVTVTPERSVTPTKELTEATVTVTVTPEEKDTLTNKKLRGFENDSDSEEEEVSMIDPKLLQFENIVNGLLIECKSQISVMEEYLNTAFSRGSRNALATLSHSIMHISKVRQLHTHTHTHWLLFVFAK